MKLIIKKLFGKYDYEFDFDKELNILIGENGCGKSTILKIIKYLSNNDLSSLSKIKFEEITLIYEDKKETIYYDDIIQNKIVNQYDFRRKLYNFIRNYKFQHYELNTNNIINEFNLFFESMIAELSIDLKYQKNEDFDNFEEYIFKDLIACGADPRKELIDYFPKEYIKFLPLYGSKDYFKFIFLCSKLQNESQSPFFFEIVGKSFNSMVSNDFSILNPINYIYDFTTFREIQIKKHFNTYERMKEILKILKENRQEDRKYLHFSDCIYNDGISNLEQYEKVKIVLDDLFFNNGLEYLFLKDEDEYIFLDKLHNCFNKFYENIRDDSYGYFITDHYETSKIFEYIISNYKNIKKDFFNEPKLKKYIEVISKYITTKEIKFDDELNFLITDKATKKVIDFNDLSSGEKKIMKLFDIVIFGRYDTWSSAGEEKLLLFDEPELSLSIFWQEMMLDDLMDLLPESSFNKIIICTQSPSILNEDKIKYLIEVKK